MKVLNKEIRLDKFEPQLILTIAFPLERELSPEEFLKAINKAIADYDKEQEQ